MSLGLLKLPLRYAIVSEALEMLEYVKVSTNELIRPGFAALILAIPFFLPVLSNAVK